MWKNIKVIICDIFYLNWFLLLYFQMIYQNNDLSFLYFTRHVTVLCTAALHTATCSCFQEENLRTDEFYWKQQTSCVCNKNCFHVSASQVLLSLFSCYFQASGFPPSLTGSFGFQIFQIVQHCQTCSSCSISSWYLREIWSNSLSVWDIWMKLSGLFWIGPMRIVNGRLTHAIKGPLHPNHQKYYIIYLHIVFGHEDTFGFYLPKI